MYQRTKSTIRLKIICDPNSPVHANNALEKGRDILLIKLAPPTCANKYINNGFIPTMAKGNTPF